MVREWLVFFGGDLRAGWWDVFTRPGFRHVLAAGFDADAGVWLVYDPGAVRTRIDAYPPGPDADLRLGQLLGMSGGRCLRFRPREGRRMAPAAFGCVGAVKALLGIRGRALSPPGLYRQLLRMGAEVAWWPAPPAPAEDVQ